MSKHKKTSQPKREKERRRRREREKAQTKLYKGVLCFPILMTVVYAIISIVFLPLFGLGALIMVGFFVAVRNPYKHPFLFKLYFDGFKSSPRRWGPVDTHMIDWERMYNRDNKKSK